MAFQSTEGVPVGTYLKQTIGKVFQHAQKQKAHVSLTPNASEVLPSGEKIIGKQISLWEPEHQIVTSLTQLPNKRGVSLTQTFNPPAKYNRHGAGDERASFTRFIVEPKNTTQAEEIVTNYVPSKHPWGNVYKPVYDRKPSGPKYVGVPVQIGQALENGDPSPWLLTPEDVKKSTMHIPVKDGTDIEQLLNTGWKDLSHLLEGA
ncbi:MAG: hypothetical protein ACKO37_05445 [Vampirovibrionales bacterium]